jgi:hypothetical protein
MRQLLLFLTVFLVGCDTAHEAIESCHRACDRQDEKMDMFQMEAKGVSCKCKPK